MGSKKIMVADDDPAIVEAIKIVLEDEGYAVEVTVDGEAVRDIDEELPDLILLDIWMSGISGEEIAKHLKSQSQTKHIPIILVSANRDCAVIAKAVGAEDYLEKPFDIDDLVQKVRVWCQA